MRPISTYETPVQSSRKSSSTLRLRPRRRSLIGRSRASVPFSAGSLGSWRQQPDDDADDQLIVSMKDHGSVDTQTGAPLQSNGQALQEYLMVLAPQRLHYEIQMVSGWDKGYPPEELVGLMQTSVGKGWHTPRFCEYPQDLVLRFSSGHSRIRKIQILSHQYKIANRLDFWIGSRKGMQSIITETIEPGPYSSEDPNASRDNNYQDQDCTFGEGDDGLDPVPRMDVEKRSIPVLQFQKLGSISFDSNTSSNFSGRELKSINVDVEGEYLRVVIRQCHVNPLNIYHQVAILALNVLGEPLEDELLGESERLDFDECEIVNGPGQGLSEPSLAHSLMPLVDVPDVPSISDAVRGLSIADIKDQGVSYMDQDIQKLISGFIKAKQDAVKVEDFASAKQYKTGYEELLQFADEIQALDIEKQRAAKHDEFDLAQELKAKVMEVKARMNAQLTLSGFHITSNDETTLISLTPVDVVEDVENSKKAPSISKSSSNGNISASADLRNVSSGSVGTGGRRIPISRKSIPSAAAIQRSFSATSDNSSDPEKSKRSDYSGRIPTPFSRSRSQSSVLLKQPSDTKLNALQPPHRTVPSPTGNSKSPHSTSTLSNAKECSPDSSQQPVHVQDEIDCIQLDELTHQEKISFAASLQVFSNRVVSCLLNRDLQLRLYAIEYVKEHLENENFTDDTDQEVDKTLLARAAFQVISIALTDTREKVVTLALTLLDQVVRFCFQNEIPSLVTFRSLEPIFSLLLVKASDLNTRVAQGTIDRIVMLCNCYTTSPYAILPLVFKPARSTVPYRQAQSRIEIVARLVDEFGVYDRAEGKGTVGGLDFENITEFSIPYLSHTNGEVRVATRKLIIDVCKFLNKTRVEQFLPGVKPLIVESIQKELVPKKARAQLAGASTARSVSHTTVPVPTSSRPSTKVPGSALNSGKRRQAPTPIGVDLHMDSLKSLLVEPDSPGFSKSSRQGSRQKSDAALAHQARLKMPLRSSIKATQALYSGVPRTMVKKQSALSPDDGNDSTASDETKIPIPRTSTSAPRAAVRPPQLKTKPNSMTSKSPKQDLKSESVSGGEASKSASDRFCVFCDERSNAFTDEGLVAHYWNECAMLANCSYCKIIIEVPTLSEHMLKECPKRKFVKQCETCREIMAADSFLAHVASGCFAVPAATVKCPLCHDILPSNEESDWKEHLLDGTGCPSNKKSRSKDQLSNRTSTQPRTSNIVPPVNTARGYNLPKIVPKDSPTSPLSSSSSSSMRIEYPGNKQKSGLLSATVSPASSTTSSVIGIDKSGASLHHTTGPSLSGSLASTSLAHLSQQRIQQQQENSEVDSAYQTIQPQHQHLEPIHPLDPCPTMIDHSGSSTSLQNSTSGSSIHSLGAGSNGSNSRIPIPGGYRSSSSNSGNQRG
ncbi:hypothetical protein BGZ46_004447 [Entomortierella lignicola]|nr:hypothetical protein BGZ46_004447 [Entomortierella lignicola]